VNNVFIVEDRAFLILIVVFVAYFLKFKSRSMALLHNSVMAYGHHYNSIRYVKERLLALVRDLFRISSKVIKMFILV
jgi:hypothetical protein